MGDKWLVVFCDPDPLADHVTRMDRFIYWFLTTFLKQGFRHCYVMRRAHHFSGWMIFNTGSNRTDVLEVPDYQPIDVGGVNFDSYTDYVDAAELSGIATIVTFAEQPRNHCTIRSHFNCVTSVKHVLGLSASRVITPWALYKLIKNWNQGGEK